MDSNSSQASGMGLPQPPGGQGGQLGFTSATDPGPAGAIVGGVPHAQAQPAPQTALPVQIADERASDDELDREWVNKAKDIVERTKADPFVQSNELNKVKAEYLKTRFSKDLNVGDKSPQ